jgi:hypothetical protein
MERNPKFVASDKESKERRLQKAAFLLLHPVEMYKMILFLSQFDDYSSDVIRWSKGTFDKAKVDDIHTGDNFSSMHELRSFIALDQAQSQPIYTDLDSGEDINNFPILNEMNRQKYSLIKVYRTSKNGAVFAICARTNCLGRLELNIYPSEVFKERINRQKVYMELGFLPKEIESFEKRRSFFGVALGMQIEGKIDEDWFDQHTEEECDIVSKALGLLYAIMPSPEEKRKLDKNGSLSHKTLSPNQKEDLIKRLYSGH